ncbi:MAG: hypothetical protein IIA87_05680 [Nanoarchaeota archaeon]|nr:hypothetical protein [Nanoarchaeota archaeon]
MAVRQYERVDCQENAVLGQRYDIAEAWISGVFGTDIVTIFGNQLTDKIVWVPYGSELMIDQRPYTLKKGNLSRFSGDRGYTKNQSNDCLQDEQGELHSMYDMRGRSALVERLNNSMSARAKQFLFDLIHNKLKDRQPLTLSQMQKTGILKGFKEHKVRLGRRKPGDYLA